MPVCGVLYNRLSHQENESSYAELAATVVKPGDRPKQRRFRVAEPSPVYAAIDHRLHHHHGNQQHQQQQPSLPPRTAKTSKPQEP